MNLIAFVISLLFAFGSVFAGRIVSYTATSTASQQEANNSAIAGVATQIASEITSTQVSTQSEIKTNGIQSSKQSFSETNKLRSQLFLQGLRIQPGAKKGKQFVCTALIDLDDATANTRFQIQEIQRNAANKEQIIREALKKKQFKMAIHEHQGLRPLILQYPALLKELSTLIPINSTYQLKTDADQLEDLIKQALSQVTLFWHEPPPTETHNAEWGPATVIAKDSEGPIADFPIYAMQNRKLLAEEKTNKKGIAFFLFHNIDENKGTHTITFEPNLPSNYVREAGIKSLVLTYESSPKKCFYQISCRETRSVCDAVDQVLAKGGFEKKSMASPLMVHITTDKAKSFASGNQKLISANVTITIDTHTFSFVQQKMGVGKDINAAKIAAISKLKSLEIRNKAANFCKE